MGPQPRQMSRHQGCARLHGRLSLEAFDIHRSANTVHGRAARNTVMFPILLQKVTVCRVEIPLHLGLSVGSVFYPVLIDSICNVPLCISFRL